MHTAHLHVGRKPTQLTVVSLVSAHGHLNISRDFGPHGCLPGIKIRYVFIEAATVTP